MRFFTPIALLLVWSLPVWADFSYTLTLKTSAGASVAGSRGRGGAPQVFKYYLKGRKVKVESGDTALIVDFVKRQVTTIDNVQKTVSITRLASSRVPSKIDIKAKEQRKIIKGYEATESILTMGIDSPELQMTGTAMHMEMDVWLVDNVPGLAELREFYKTNGTRFSWFAPTSGGDPAVQSGIEELLNKIAELNTLPLEAVVRLKRAKGPLRAKELTHAQQTEMREAMAQLAVIRMNGGQPAEIAARALAEMSAMTDPIELAEADATLFEITLESTNFSSTPIPDFLFDVPSGYRHLPEH